MAGFIYARLLMLLYLSFSEPDCRASVLFICFSYHQSGNSVAADGSWMDANIVGSNQIWCKWKQVQLSRNSILKVFLVRKFHRPRRVDIQLSVDDRDLENNFNCIRVLVFENIKVSLILKQQASAHLTFNEFDELVFALDRNGIFYVSWVSLAHHCKHVEAIWRLLFKLKC